MKEKLKSVVLLFFIALVIVPSFIYEASAKQMNLLAEENQKNCNIASCDEDINFPYISGYTDQTFRPNNPVTREELATMLARLITKNSIPTEENQYKDVGDKRFSKDAINYIVQLGIMQSVEDNIFKPKSPVDYPEFKIIVNQIKPYIKNEKIQLPSIKENITRAETVVILNELFNVQCNTGHTCTPFIDIEPSMQAYKDIICATQPRE